ncbi:MAG: hypothetical protein ABFC84_02155 [Veillonellales bacterium]
MNPKGDGARIVCAAGCPGNAIQIRGSNPIYPSDFNWHFNNSGGKGWN